MPSFRVIGRNRQYQIEGDYVTMSRLSVVLLIVSICLGSTSASGIGNLFEVETVFIDQLQSYIEKTQKKSEEIQRWVRYSVYKLVLLTPKNCSIDF